MSNSRNELIPSYVDIEAELHRQRELVAELKSELNVISNQRDEIRNERDILRERMEAINRQNSRLRQLELNRKMKDKKRKKLQSKVDSITNRKGHRRASGPAKLRFRKQRTTHRTVYCQDRKW